jgi:hypothetical protein
MNVHYKTNTGHKWTSSPVYILSGCLIAQEEIHFLSLKPEATIN